VAEFAIIRIGQACSGADTIKYSPSYAPTPIGESAVSPAVAK